MVSHAGLAAGSQHPPQRRTRPRSKATGALAPVTAFSPAPLPSFKGKSKEPSGLTCAEMTVGQQKGFKGGKVEKVEAKVGNRKKGEPKRSATGPPIPASAPHNLSA